MHISHIPYTCTGILPPCSGAYSDPPPAASEPALLVPSINNLELFVYVYVCMCKYHYVLYHC